MTDLLREARVLTFRRRPYAARRKRKSPWRVLFTGLLSAVAVVGLPLTLVAWVLTSPRFALQRVEVEGGERVPPSWVESALAPLHGRNLVRLPLGEAERLVAQHPWVEAVEVSKRLPDRLRVRVRERRPAALLRRGADVVYLDAAGREIAPLEDGAHGVDLLLVSLGGEGVETVSSALELAQELEQAAPEWAARLSEVEVLGEGDFRITTGALPFPLVVRAGTLAQRVAGLHELLAQIERRYPKVESVDLRFARRIVVQPAALPAEKPGGAPGRAPAAAPGRGVARAA